MERTCENGTLTCRNVGQKVTLLGWVNRRRNLGGLVFIDLRDRSGIVQITFDETAAEKVKAVRSEYVIQVMGTVALRKDPNPKIPTGEIEVMAEDIMIINTSKTPPFAIGDESSSAEDTRLTYRYLDLRRPSLQKNLILRHRVCMIARQVLDRQGFVEVETPILARSTPEGARDYLVPSRIYQGKFWALPQSPQIYKQLLMIAGMEKYFQIARCFRDEDLRADRQPEFTQIDIEMSFADEEKIFALIELLMKEIFRGTIDYDLSTPFPRMTYRESMARYGTDKPDVRFANEINDLGDVFADTTFPVFRDVLDQKGIIAGLKFAGAAGKYSRKTLDKLQEFVKNGFKAKALFYLKKTGGELSGSFAKQLSEDEKRTLVKRMSLADDDLLLVIADQASVAEAALGALRVKVAKDLDLIKEDRDYRFVWITDFPMFEYSASEQRWVSCHHPFTAPKAEDIDKLISDPGNVSSRAYDLVLNGFELLSGSIRIHDQDLQSKVFEAIGLSEKMARERFGFFLDAFQYGTPPHGGIGLGLERLIMVLAGTDNIRDVVAFPTTNSAMDLMSQAPNTVDDEQLAVLGIKVDKNNS